jgi:peptidoglycan hydrolase-like protein with peptidoglycan-binding domain
MSSEKYIFLLESLAGIGILSVIVAIIITLQPTLAQSRTELIADLRAQITELQNRLNTLLEEESEIHSGPCKITRDLSLNSQGEDVRCLQEYLNSSGYTVAKSGLGSAGNETTYYGSLTQSAIGKWQDDYNIPYGSWRGYFGPKSRLKFEEITDGFFSLCDAQETPSVWLESPNNGGVYTKGDTVSIRWSSCNVPENSWVGLAAINANQSVDANIKLRIPVIDGGYTWKIRTDGYCGAWGSDLCARKVNGRCF